jgi:hypothetical protein
MCLALFINFKAELIRGQDSAVGIVNDKEPG